MRISSGVDWKHRGRSAIVGSASAAAVIAVGLAAAPAGAQNAQPRSARFVTFSVPGATGGDGYGTFPTGFDPGRGVAVVGVWENSRTGNIFLRAANGTITPIKPPPGSIGWASYRTINSAGTIAGFYKNAHNTTRGFLEPRSGSFAIFALPGGGEVYTAPPAINRNGVVTGIYSSARHNIAFIRDPDGAFTQFSAPGARAGTFPQSVNANGKIVGYYVTLVNGPAGFTSRFHGFIRTPDGTLTTYEAPGASDTFLDSINAAGDIAGNYYDAGNTSHGFLLSAGGDFIPFDVLGAGAGHPGNPQGTFVAAINSSRDITGYYYDSRSVFTRGYLRSQDGTIITVDIPGAGNTTPVGINSNCVIAGSYSDKKTATSHGFLRIPPSRSTSLAASCN